MYKRMLTGVAAALLISTAIVPRAAAQSEAGGYLAGRHAAVNSDFREAARFYTQALAQDSGNVELLESTVLSLISLGELEKAAPLARMLEEKNQTSQVARLAMIADMAQSEDFAALISSETTTDGIGPWVDGLVKAWAQVGAGDVTSALASFDALSEEAGLEGFVMYHKALALASVGDYEGAEAIFAATGAGAAGQTRRGVMAHVEVLAQLERYEDALEVLSTSFGDATDPELERMIRILEAREPMPFTHVEDAKSGIAEVFFTFAAVLRAESAADNYVLLYARIARYLRPDHVDALLLTAGLLETLDQNALAIEEYGSVSADDPAFHVAELGRADALRRSGKDDQAIEVLQQLARTHGDLAVVHSTLGDMLRGQDDYDAAIAAYDRAIERAPETAPVRWVLHYSRGIANERAGNDIEMEADFRAALALNPEQPQVLNYLGYSMVEQNRNLEEALNMIERAVAASPSSGYIVDSLGWVFYRLGRYEEAVVQMERAVELLAVDPVVNDHLGDVYWAVGRNREAEFQWSRALSFIEEDDADGEADPLRIRRKLEIGLDAVLEEEGAPPLKLSNDI
ncbi:TPR domain protein [Sulfitobacter noctilucae]|uniref:tetratricopeptide repeat protein n=1 Tax=Sulfitobacter noctilucae TaxID=1342302 RepID=UPI00046889F7|nr:tetratricopeptide repeat protein [Sulfitobacter noctilucae]KIN70737.1 TPR domain protein [Sulfitobacter noctilucae]